MWSTLENFFVVMALTILKETIKNPKSVAKEVAIIANFAQVATEADTTVNGTVWTSTPAPAPAPIQATA